MLEARGTATTAQVMEEDLGVFLSRCNHVLRHPFHGMHAVFALAAVGVSSGVSGNRIALEWLLR